MIETNTILKYKATGLDWIPKVPEHWQLKKLKFCDEIIMGQSPESESYNENKDGIAFLQGNAEFGKVHPKENIFTSKPTKIAPKGSILYSVRAPIGAINIADKDYCIGRGLCAINAKENTQPFLFYLLILLKQELNSLGNGSTFKAISVADIANIKIPVPPISEQDEIVQYIKAQEEKINLFIQKKQRFIELLKEQRQRIINYSVTKGINPNAELKDTGIEWLGEIPKHWKLRRLKNVAEVVLGKMLCNEDKGGYALKPYLKSKNIGWDKVIIEEVDEMWFSPKEMLTYRVKENDLLVSEGGEVGKTCIWKNDLDECYIQNSVHKLTCFEDCLPEFYLFWMGMLGSVGYFRSIVNQVSIAHLTREKVVTVICLHPPIEEQKQIVSHIKTETATIDTAISKTEREIELIKEYKEAMISEAVMGKRK